MKRIVQVVFGLGSGRCGTQSLAAWLNTQEGAIVTHESRGPAITWNSAEGMIDQVLHEFYSSPQARLIGDVASYYLPYVEHILAAQPTARFICLKRDRGETIASFLTKTLHKNHWIEHDGARWKHTPWDRCFPKYAESDKAAAIGRYWDDYYRQAATLEARHPSAFRVFLTAALNEAKGQHAILDFLSIPMQSRRLAVGLRLNKSRPQGIRRLLVHVMDMVPGRSAAGRHVLGGPRCDESRRAA